MATRFYINDKKVTKKHVVEIVGVDRLKRMVDESKEMFFEDPLVRNDYMIGFREMLTIRFE